MSIEEIIAKTVKEAVYEAVYETVTEALRESTREVMGNALQELMGGLNTSAPPKPKVPPKPKEPAGLNPSPPSGLYGSEPPKSKYKKAQKKQKTESAPFDGVDEMTYEDMMIEVKDLIPGDTKDETRERKEKALDVIKTKYQADSFAGIPEEKYGEAIAEVSSVLTR